MVKGLLQVDYIDSDIYCFKEKSNLKASKIRDLRNQEVYKSVSNGVKNEGETEQ